MLNSLDLTIIVVMAIMAVSLLALCLMFLVRNQRVRQICLYIVAALGVYVASVSVRIFWLGFEGQMLLGLALGAASIGAVVLERLSKGDDKKMRIARLVAAASLILGVANAFFI